MFILTGDQVPKRDWRSIGALCLIFFLARAAVPLNAYMRPDPFPEVRKLY